MIRFGLSSVFLATVFMAVLMVISPGEALFLKEVFPVLPQDINKYDNSLWISEFQNWAFWGAIGATIFGFIWLCIGQFMLRVEDYSDAGGRGWWVILLLFLLLLTFITGFILIPASQDFGKPIAVFFYLINAFFTFWFSSVIFSPSNVKYAPWLSKNLAIPANALIKTFQGAE